MADDNFSITITNNSNGGKIQVTKNASYSDWRIPSDGLDGFGNMPFSAKQATPIAVQGAVLQGASSGVRQLTITLEAPPTESKRDEAYKVLAIGSPVKVEAMYVRSRTRTIEGIVTQCKVNEGNIYEPTTVTAAIDCLNPFFTSTSVTVEATGYTYSASGGYIELVWQPDVDGDMMAVVEEVMATFPTGNTDSYKTTKASTLTLTIDRYPRYSIYALPDQTVFKWVAYPNVGTTIAANYSMKQGVTWYFDQQPQYQYGSSSYSSRAAYLSAWRGVGYREIMPGRYTKLTLRVELDPGIAPTTAAKSYGSLVYTPRWMGI